MKRVLLSLLLFGLALGLASRAEEAHGHVPIGDPLVGDGSVKINRLPLLSTETQMELSQGWNSPEPPGTHGGQYATDWRKTNGVTFPVHAASEGDAICFQNAGSAGNYIQLTRDDGKKELYMHLLACPFTTPAIHFEQGDFLATAGMTGTDNIHLHYEVKQGSQSVAHCLSQFCDFDDDYIHGSPEHHNHPVISDNAGPGVNQAENIRVQFWQKYFGPHWLGLNAWDVHGSSIELAPPYGPEVFAFTHAGDPALHQWFQRNDAGRHGFNRPDACGKVYLVPLGFFNAWFNNAGQLGQARSSVVFTWPGIWSQTFRFGYMWSAQYGANPTVVFNVDTTTCY